MAGAPLFVNFQMQIGWQLGHFANVEQISRQQRPVNLDVQISWQACCEPGSRSADSKAEAAV